MLWILIFLINYDPGGEHGVCLCNAVSFSSHFATVDAFRPQALALRLINENTKMLIQPDDLL